MADVKFVLDAETAKAVKGILNVMNANKETEKSFGKSIKKANKFDKSLMSLKKTALGVAGGFIGAAGVGLAVSSMTRSFQEGIRTTIKFENEMTGLLSLGDNINNIDDVKASVLDMSGAFGISRKSTADAMFDLQSGASSLSKSFRDDVLKEAVELSKVTGTDLPTSLKGLLKTFLIYKDELGTVNQAQNVLFKTAELGFLNFTDLATLFPDVAASAKSLGFSINDVSASLIVATQLGGRNEKTFTGVRNVFLRMQKAVDEGLVPATGNFLEKLEALSKVDAQTVVKVFGIEAATAISNLVQNTGEVIKNFKIMDNLAGDLAKNKLFERLGDKSFAFKELHNQIKQTTENVPLTRDISSKEGKLDTEIALSKLGFRDQLPEELAGLAGPLAIASRLNPFQLIFGGNGRGRSVKRGEDLLLEQTRSIPGQEDQAQLMALRFGRESILPPRDTTPVFSAAGNRARATVPPGTILPGGQIPGTITGDDGAELYRKQVLSALNQVVKNTEAQTASTKVRNAQTE